ncbi:MAG TPA: hypothetical protein VHC20_05385 [Candidatus Paceibacterota bacterium]|nr:hypothetical protein [Candidatus Paceibacterota bacterium]
MSEVRINRTRKAKVEDHDPISTVGLDVLFGAIFRGIRSLASESPVKSAPTAAVSTSATVPAAIKAALVPTIQGHTSPRIGTSVSEVIPASVAAELKAIASEAPYVTRSRAEEITALAKAVVASAGDRQRLASSVKSLRSTVNADFNKITADTVFLRVRESLTEIRFTPEIIKPESGYILARQGPSGPQIRVDVRQASDGGVEIETDADGFHGETCRSALNELEAKLHEKGVRLQGGARQPKRNRYAAIRLAVRQR